MIIQNQCYICLWFYDEMIVVIVWANYPVKLLAGNTLKGFGLPGKTSNIKVILNGGQRVTFLRPDGYFSLYPLYVFS